MRIELNLSDAVISRMARELDKSIAELESDLVGYFKSFEKNGMLEEACSEAVDY